jgi:hypothetical protein
MAATSYIRRNSDDVRFCTRPTRFLVDLDSASSLKQQSADTHIAPLGHIILFQRQPVLNS